MKLQSICLHACKNAAEHGNDAEDEEMKRIIEIETILDKFAGISLLAIIEEEDHGSQGRIGSDGDELIWYDEARPVDAVNQVEDGFDENQADVHGISFQAEDALLCERDIVLLAFPFCIDVCQLTEDEVGDKETDAECSPIGLEEGAIGV